MKVNTTTRSSEEESSLLASATEEELFIAQILLDLPDILPLLKSLPPSKWGSKRRRSRMAGGASSSRALSSPPRKTQVLIEERKPKAEVEVAAASPVTPLSFSSGESDEKSRHAFKKNSKKRPREEYIDMIGELTRRRDLLTREIEKVTKYYSKLNVYNSELKAMKEEVLNSCQREEETNVGIGLTRFRAAAHSQPFVADQMGLGPITSQLYSSYNGLGSVNHVGQYRTPDLNICAEVAFEVDPSQPLDTSTTLADRRARFAEARRRRRGIMKIKHMRSVCGIKLPETS